MKILKAIKNLLLIQGKTSLSEIAATVGEKRFKVAEILAENRDLYITEGRNIIALSATSAIRREQDRFFTQGGSYFAEPINYGYTVEIKVPACLESYFTNLRRDYVCGGFGDSYVMKNILVGSDEKVLEKIKELGLISFHDHAREKTVDDFWKE